MPKPLCKGSISRCNSPLPGSLAQNDAVLAHRGHARRRLLTARNTLIPVSRLPLEVLTTIFLYLLPLPSDLFTPPSSKNLRTASQTCMSWRAAALGCAVLWAHPETRGVDTAWTAEMLRRSNRAALVLHAKICSNERRYIAGKQQLDSPNDRQLEACRLVFAQMDRVTEIHLEGDAHSLTNLLDKASPRLRSLIVVCKEAGNVPALPTARLGAAFLRGGAPALQKLELKGCAMDWDAPIWKSCTRLKSLVVEGTRGTQPTVGVILGVLGGMKQLRTLRLEEGLVRSSGEVSEAESIALDELEELFLSGTTIGVASLLKHLALPARARVKLQCVCRGGSVELPALCAAISALHSAPAPRQRFIQSAHIIVDTERVDICLSASRANPDSSQGKTSREGATCLTVFTDLRHSTISTVLLDMLHVVPLHSVESLLLDDHAKVIDNETRRDLHALLPRVRAISTRPSASPSLTAFFADMWDMDIWQFDMVGFGDNNDYAHWFQNTDLPA